MVPVSLVRVLGAIDVVLDDGRVVVPPSSTQRRILGLLAISAGREVSATQLGEFLELSPNAVRVAVGRLRRLAPGSWLTTTAVGYRLAVPTDVALLTADLDRARSDPGALERAVAHWRGDPFAGLGHETWARGEAVRLAELHAAAVEALAEARLEAGVGGEAVVALEALLSAHPWRDRSWGLLIRALASSGRRVEALRAYQRHRRRLVEETGVEPSDELRRIEQRIVAGWDGRSAPGGSDGRDHARAGPAGQPLIGRGRELAALVGALPRPSQPARAICVMGAAGIGKTRLMEAFMSGASHAGALVVSARCDEAVGALLHPFRTVIDELWTAASHEVTTHHRRRHGNRLASVVPHVHDRADTSPATTADDATARFMLFEAIRDLLTAVAARQPVLVAIDDVHFADPTTLAALRHLVRSLGSAPVTLVVATREPRADTDVELRAMLTELTRSGGERVVLTAFGEHELRELVALALEERDRGPEIAVDDEVVRLLAADTEGNPLLATHLLRHWIDSGMLRVDGRRATLFGDHTVVSPVLRDLVWARLRALDPAAPDVLAAAAVLGDPIVERALADTSGREQSEVDRVLDLVTRGSILTEAVEPTKSIRFAHGLIARAVVQDLAASKRQRLHERAARALADLREVEPDATSARIARQYADAQLPAEALRWALQAGHDAATTQGGAEDAAAWYRTALDHATAIRAADGVRAEVLVQLGEAEQRAGIAGSLDRLVEAGELARSAGRDDCLVRAALATDRGFVRLGDFVPTQLGLVEAALATVPATDTDTRARLLALLGECLVGSTDVERREAAARAALAAADASSDTTLIGRIAPAILYALWTPRSADLRREIGDRAVAAAIRTRDPHLHFVALVARHNTQVALGDADGARASLHSLRAVVARHPEPRMRWALGATETHQATMAADFVAAERLVEDTFALGSAIGETDAFSLYASQLYVLRTFQGRHAEMLPLIEQIVASGSAPLPFRLAHGIACATVNRDDVAAHLLSEGVNDGFEAVPQNILWLTSIVGYAVLAIELADRHAASMLYPLLEPYAEQVAFNGVTSQGPVSAYVGKMASMLGRHDEADHHLRAAMRMAESFGWSTTGPRPSTRSPNHGFAATDTSTALRSRVSLRQPRSATPTASPAGLHGSNT